jgi:hypothetical protein
LRRGEAQDGGACDVEDGAKVVEDRLDTMRKLVVGVEEAFFINWMYGREVELGHTLNIDASIFTTYSTQLSEQPIRIIIFNDGVGLLQVAHAEGLPSKRILQHT